MSLPSQRSTALREEDDVDTGSQPGTDAEVREDSGAAGDAAAVETPGEPPREQPARRLAFRRPTLRRPGRRAALGLAAVLATGAAAGTAFLARADAQQDSARDAAVLAARQEALALTTVSAATADENLRALTDGATGAFKKQVAAAGAGFRQVLDQNGIRSDGSVTRAGVVDLHGDRATVLLAVDAVLTDVEGRTQQRQYRMRVQVQDVDGTWLVSGMEYVP